METLSESRRGVEPSEPIARIERRMRWSVRSALGYLAILGLFLAVAIVSLLRPAGPPTAGLPADADVGRAAQRAAGLGVETGGLRMHAAILGGEASDGGFGAADLHRVTEAEELLDRAGSRIGRDPRLVGSRAALRLVRRRYAEAEKLYRASLARSRNYGEARLGLAVALASRADATADPLAVRALQLQAIAQCAAVSREDPVYPAALYDRAVLLARVGRLAEARRHLERFRALEPSGVWMERLQREVERAPS